MLQLCLTILVVVAQSSETLPQDLRLHVNDTRQTSEIFAEASSQTNVGDIVQSDLAPGSCIQTDQGLVVGSLLKLSPCNQQAVSFKWNKDAKVIQVASNPELCVGMGSSSEPVSQLLTNDEVGPTSTLLLLQSCIADEQQQQWLIEGQHGSIRSKARPDLCIAPDNAGTGVASSPLKLAYCRHVQKEQGFRYIAVDDAAELLDLADAKQHSKEDSAHAKEQAASQHSSHSAEVGATGKLHMKHGRKKLPDAKILNLDISESSQSQAYHENDEMSDSALMRRNADTLKDSVKMPELGSNAETADEQKNHASEPRTSEKSDIDTLLERISEGLIEEEDGDDELSAEDLDTMLDRAVVAKRRRPPPPPPPPPKIDCQWGRWKKWSSCSADCGGGTKDRERGERIRAENGGLPCDGDAEEEKQCNKQPCSPPPAPITAPPTAPPAATPPPMMAKGGAERAVSVAPAVFVMMLLAACQSLINRI